MQPLPERFVRVIYPFTAQTVEKKPGPVLGPGEMALLIQKSICAAGQGIVEDDAVSLERKPALFIYVSDSLRKSRCPGIAAAGSIRTLGDPHWRARYKFIPDGHVEVEITHCK